MSGLHVSNRSLWFGRLLLTEDINFSHTGVSLLHSFSSSCLSVAIGQCSSEGVREQLSSPCGWLVSAELFVGDELCCA